jgi:hypothetical protein
MRRLEAEKSDFPDNVFMKLVVRDIGLDFVISWIRMKSLKFRIKTRLLSIMKQCLTPRLKFLRCLIENQFLTSSVQRAWRKSGAPTVWLYYQ